MEGMVNFTEGKDGKCLWNAVCGNVKATPQDFLSSPPPPLPPPPPHLHPHYFCLNKYSLSLHILVSATSFPSSSFLFLFLFFPTFFSYYSVLQVKSIIFYIFLVLMFYPCFVMLIPFSSSFSSFPLYSVVLTAILQRNSNKSRTNIRQTDKMSIVLLNSPYHLPLSPFPH